MRLGKRERAAAWAAKVAEYREGGSDHAPVKVYLRAPKERVSVSDYRRVHKLDSARVGRERGNGLFRPATK